MYWFKMAAAAFTLNCILFVIFFCIKVKFKKPLRLRRCCLLLIFSFLTETSILCILTACIRQLTGSSAMPFHTAETVIFFAAVSVLFLSFSKDLIRKQKNLLRLCGLAGILPFILEVALFNYASYQPYFQKLQQKTLSISSASTTGNVKVNGSRAVVDSEGSLIFSNVDTSLHYVTIYTSGSKAMDTISFEVKNGSSPDSFRLLGTKRFLPFDLQTTFTIETDGNTSELKLDFSSGSQFTLYSVQLNALRPFSFNLLRYTALVLMLLLLIGIVRHKLWKVDYDNRRKVHRLTICLTMLICMVLSALMMLIPSPSYSYPLSRSPDQYNNYEEQFDAFQKGQLNLDVPVDPKLARMENPYDRTARNAQNVSYLWDRAFYHGKYYSYFGVAPIFIVYYPYYFLTGYLPSYMFVCTVFALLSILFFFLLALECIQIFCRKVNLFLLLIGLFASVLTTDIFMLQSCADEYYTPALSGLCFSLLFLFCSFRAWHHEQNGKRLTLFMFAGISYVLIIASRPDVALTGLIVVPIFLSVLLHRNFPVRSKLSCAFSFLTPILLGGALIMYYNYLRFDSPFEFGETYQLTVSDIALNTIQFKYFFTSLFHYIIQLPNTTSGFPFLKASTVIFNFEKGNYIDPTVGAFAYPSLWILLLFPLFLMRTDKNIVKKSTYFCMLTTVVLISFFSYCIGGVSQRYTADIMPTITILAFLVLLELNHRAKMLKTSGWILTVLLFCGSIAVCTAMVFSNERNTIANSFPGLILYWERLLLFR